MIFIWVCWADRYGLQGESGLLIVLRSPYVCILIINIYFIAFAEAIIRILSIPYLWHVKKWQKHYSNPAFMYHGWTILIILSWFPKEMKFMRSSPLCLFLSVSSSLPLSLSPSILTNNIWTYWPSSVIFALEGEVWNILSS